MKAPGFPTQMGEEPGAFRMYVGGACRVVALVERPLILKDEVRARPARLRRFSARGMSGEPSHPQVKTR